jgi:signal transduction histidine kinase
MRQNKANRSLTVTAKMVRTAILAFFAMGMIWIGLYLYTNNFLNRYVESNLQLVSENIISGLEESFLQMERMTFALDSNEDVTAFLREELPLELADSAGKITADVMLFQKYDELMEHVIIANPGGGYYRFSGNLDNTSVKKLLRITENIEAALSFTTTLEDSEYIGYAAPLHDGITNAGKVIILTSQAAILKLFDGVGDISEMKIALCADRKVIFSKIGEYIGMNADDIIRGGEYYSYERIGLTPFELLISYEAAGKELRRWFIVSMAAFAVFLFTLFGLFLRFWWKQFFVPVQQVISDVERIGDNQSQKLGSTGLEHFDGLVDGINDMIERLEQKEKEIFDARYSLKEAELRREKALLISLKKQIDAHFTVNVLAAIKALAANGENEKAGNMCDGLSYLLRYANAGEASISVMEEFCVLEKYVDIMQIRYPGRFSADIEIEDELAELMIPRMLLQPIVENSIRHGILDNDGRQGHIRVYCRICDDSVAFVIEDNGRGMSPDELEALNNKINSSENEDDVAGLSHVALPNIQRRIVSYYGTGYGITVSSVKGEGTVVTLTLPAIRSAFAEKY